MAACTYSVRYRNSTQKNKAEWFRKLTDYMYFPYLYVYIS